VDNIKRLIKPEGHFINNRKVEIIIGAILFMIGALLLWDAFDGRNKKAPWPVGAVTPW
jgi:hypothetical protein